LFVFTLLHSFNEQGSMLTLINKGIKTNGIILALLF